MSVCSHDISAFSDISQEMPASVVFRFLLSIFRFVLIPENYNIVKRGVGEKTKYFKI